MHIGRTYYSGLLVSTFFHIFTSFKISAVTGRFEPVVGNLRPLVYGVRQEDGNPVSTFFQVADRAV